MVVSQTSSRYATFGHALRLDVLVHHLTAQLPVIAHRVLAFLAGFPFRKSSSNCPNCFQVVLVLGT